MHLFRLLRVSASERVSGPKRQGYWVLRECRGREEVFAWFWLRRCFCPNSFCLWQIEFALIFFIILWGMESGTFWGEREWWNFLLSPAKKNCFWGGWTGFLVEEKGFSGTWRREPLIKKKSSVKCVDETIVNYFYNVNFSFFILIK